MADVFFIICMTAGIAAVCGIGLTLLLVALGKINV